MESGGGSGYYHLIEQGLHHGEYEACQFNSGRARTDFWIVFSKTIISFPRLKVIKYVVNRDLKKNEGTKLFQ